MIKTNQQRLAQAISLITNPALIVAATIAIVVGHFADSPREFWQASATGIGLLVVPGLLYSFYIWRQEGSVDIDLTDRHDRIVPLMLSSLGALIGSFIAKTSFDNQTLTQMSFILVTLLVALTIVTTVWKISLHAATIAALTTLLVVYRSHWFLLGYLVLIPIAWSRLRLRQHTPNQLLGGTILGIALTSLAAKFFDRYF